MANGFKLEWKGRQVSDEVRSAAINGLREGAEHILDESNKLAPIDEGTLVNSGNIAVDETTLIATISYDTEYAIKQHEDTTLKHLNGRQAKFLETAIKENWPDVQKYIADKLKQVIG